MIVMTPVEGVLVGEYLSYFFNSPAMRRSFESIRSGSTVPHLTCGAVKELRIPLPSVAEQWQVINQLDELEAQISRLREIASVKLAALDELKLSVLHQAFGGQLTSDKPMSTVSCPPLQSTSPEFSATIIALDYERHRRRQRENTCGRVKGQKVLHWAEARAKLDLGRRPIKDAAGPNDFQHMLKAEAWAKQNDFFEMVPRDGGGYDFKPLPAYEALLARTPEVLGDSRERIEAVIDLVIPLDTKATEVLATVYAAWNNLLMDGVTVTDESIVRAARDDWHPDKLCIPVSKFREAIAFIRSKGLVPDGTGKYVGGQQSLQLQ